MRPSTPIPNICRSSTPFSPDEGFDINQHVVMPFKSKAQRRKFAELLVKGKISPETFEEWNRETGAKKLPERVTPKRTAKRKRTVKRARNAKSR
jgi:hypothetical protein